MNTSRTISRRRFLKTSAGGGVTVLYLTNGGKVVAQTPAAPASFAEAPALAELVAAGSLPAIQDRLPVNPLVVEPTESIGKYGGTWRTALLGGADTLWLARIVGYDYLLRYSPEWDEVVPGIATGYEVSPDNMTFTFALREGMKWSDGAPFTADDILFYVNDYYLNPNLNGSTGVNPFTATKIDDLSFSVTFERPNGLFISNLGSSAGEPWTQYPKHYLSQFHQVYNTTNLDQLVAEAGVADWIELFRTRGSSIPGTPYNALWQNAELPRLHAWLMTTPYGDGDRVTFERNPYYWKVDPAGNQLPYIDSVNFDVIQDAEVLLLKASAGEIDMHTRHINTLQNKPVLAGTQESGQYHFLDLIQAIMNTGCFMLNMTHKDPLTREIFAAKDFRVGLSHAIDRQEIIDTVYVSQGEPWQCGPRPEAPFYNETLAKQYTEYDVALANEHLDRVLPNKDGDGWRLRSDGSKLVFVIEVATGQFPELVDVAGLVVSYWREVGIDVQVRPEDRSLMFERTAANDHDVAVWPGGSGVLDALSSGYMYLPLSNSARYGVGWAYWWSPEGTPAAEPVEPPESIKQQFVLYEELTAVSDPEAQYELMRQILAIAQEEFLAIGISLPAPGYGIVKNTMKNVPASMFDATVYPTPGPSNTAQYFFDV